MELRQLELFVTVAQEGSIHGAARRLMLAQPTISQALRKLERHVGAPLLIRSHRGIELTDAGTILANRARDILQRISFAVDETRSASRLRRRLKVGLMAGRLSAAELTNSIVTTFRRQHPEIDISLQELTFADQAEVVAAGEVDVAIVRPPYDDDRLALTPLFTEPRLLCFGAEHKFADADKLDASDVLDEPVLNLTNAPPAWSGFWALDDLRNEPARVCSDPALTVFELQLTLAATRCVISVAASGWRMGIANPFVRALPLVGAAPTEVAVGFRRGGHRSADVDAFVSCARAVTHELAYTVPGAEIIT